MITRATNDQLRLRKPIEQPALGYALDPGSRKGSELPHQEVSRIAILQGPQRNRCAPSKVLILEIPPALGITC